MARSLIQTVNQSSQPVAIGGIISLGSTQRRYGCNLRLSGNGIEVTGDGYFSIDADVSVTPTAAGPVTVALYRNGQQIPGAIAYTTGTEGAPVSVSISSTIRRGCCCEEADNITAVLEEGAGNVQNIAVRVVKE